MVVGDLVQEVDVLVVGSGPGGYVAAIRAAQLGRKVTIVERHKVGGVCLNQGCIPSKALIYAGERLVQIKEADELGIEVAGDVSLNLTKLMQWKDSIVNKLTGGVEALLKGNQIEILFGDVYFSGVNKARVVSDHANQTYQFQDVIIATGSRPVELPALAFDKKRILSSTELLSIAEVPKTLVIVGGGYIGLELGTAFAKFGTAVTILEGSSSLLPGTDPSLTRIAVRRLKNLGVTMVTGAMVNGGKNSGNHVEIDVAVNGEAKRFEAEYCMVAIGRTPNTDEMGLEQIGIRKDGRGFIEINARCQSNVDHIYAIGDCAGGALLAHKASYEGKVAAEVIAGQHSVIDYQAMPYVIFSDPEIAYTGLTEEAAKKEGYEAVVSRFSFAANGRALTTGSGEGFVQMIAEKETGRLLGVQVVGPEASNLISEAVLAIEMGANVEDLSLTIHAHPTLAEVVMEAAEGIMGNAIHMVNR